MTKHPECPRCKSTETRRVTNYGRPVGTEFQCLTCGRRWEHVSTRQHETRARDLALKAARERTDRDIEPVVYAFTMMLPDFILVDVTYHSRGHRALYEYRVRDGALSLAQD